MPLHFCVVSESSPPNHPPSLPPTILCHFNPTRQRAIHRHTDPHSSSRHRTQPERRQHQKHRPHHQINNHVILCILNPGEIPATVGIAVVEYIQQPAIEPPRQFPPEGEEEQCELHKRQRHYHLYIPRRAERDQRNTDHQRHLQQRLHHGQRLAHAVECRERRYATEDIPSAGCQPGGGIGDGAIDIATITGINTSVL